MEINFPKWTIQPPSLPLLNIPPLWKSKIITILKMWKKTHLVHKKTPYWRSSLSRHLGAPWFRCSYIAMEWACENCDLRINCISIINFQPDLWSMSIVLAVFLPVIMLVLLSLYRFTFPFNQRNHHLHEVVKSFINFVKSLLDFFELSFIVDGSFSTKTLISHQIKVKILRY